MYVLYVLQGRGLSKRHAWPDASAQLRELVIAERGSAATRGPRPLLPLPLCLCGGSPVWRLPAAWVRSRRSRGQINKF